MRIRHVIWDLDGTLIDSASEVQYHLRRAIATAGITEAQCVGELRIGPTLAQVIRGAYCDVTEEQLQKAMRLFRDSYDHSGFLHTFPFPGIEPLLDRFAGVQHHIVTNKPAFATEGVLKKLQWQRRFVSVRSPYIEQGQLVSKSRLFADVMREYAIDRCEIVGVGDMVSDAVAARDNGMLALGVTWGTGRSDELLPVCDDVFSAVGELVQFFAEHSL